MTAPILINGMKPEQRTVSQAGQVFIEGRDWAALELVDHINRRVLLQLDVVDGELVLHVYSLTGQYICKAQLVTKEEWVMPMHRTPQTNVKGATQ